MILLFGFIVLLVPYTAAKIPEGKYNLIAQQSYVKSCDKMMFLRVSKAYKRK